MTASSDAQPMPPQKPPKRRLRNYLLNPGFQLKYTGMVVLVTVLVTGTVGFVLGKMVYDQSRETSQMLLVGGGAEHDLEMDPELHDLFVTETEEEDRELRNDIITGVVSMVFIVALALGFTGIVVTHRVVGPAYKLKLLLGDVAKGRLNQKGGLRKGDELQDVGDSLRAMVIALRERRESELSVLDSLIEDARKADTAEAVVADLEKLRERFQGVLDA